MKLELTNKQFRRMLDLVYIGNWVVNSCRGDDRIEDYDIVESAVFSACKELGMNSLFENHDGNTVPSRAFIEGGIHEAIVDYEDVIFFEILAEELARRDLAVEGSASDNENLNDRVGEYLAEFEAHGTDNISVNIN